MYIHHTHYININISMTTSLATHGNLVGCSAKFIWVIADTSVLLQSKAHPSFSFLNSF